MNWACLRCETSINTARNFHINPRFSFTTAFLFLLLSLDSTLRLFLSIQSFIEISALLVHETSISDIALHNNFDGNIKDWMFSFHENKEKRIYEIVSTIKSTKLDKTSSVTHRKKKTLHPSNFLILSPTILVHTVIHSITKSTSFQ